MVSPELQELAQRAEQLYEQKLKAHLEPIAMHQFIAIEPISGDFFLGKTMAVASAAALEVYPDRMTHMMRVGHPVAVEIGCALS